MRVHTGQVLATSNTVSFTDFNAPQQLRLSQGNTVNDMCVMWTSNKRVGTPEHVFYLSSRQIHPLPALLS